MTCDLSRHRTSAAAEPELQDHTAGRSTISPISPAWGWHRKLRSLVHNILVIYKAHRRPSCPPRRKTGGASSPFSGEKKETAGWASEPRERALDLMGKEDRGSPVFVPSPWSICDSHKRSHRSASAKAGPAPRGTQVKAPSSESEHTQWQMSQSGQSAPSRADSACSALKQTTHRLCVSPSRDSS